MIHSSVRAVAVLVVCLAALSPCPVPASAVGAADDVIKAAKGGKSLLRGRSAAKIPYSDLGKLTKVDNVDQLLGVGMDELKLTDTQAIRLRPVFLSLDNGDQLLLTCLKHPGCDPDVFASIANTSPLHAEIIGRKPWIGLTHANQEVGAVTERLMDRFYRYGGWQRVEGQVGRHGIDGLYVKIQDGAVKDVLVVESKYNTSALKETNFGTQMSETWLLRKMEELRAQYPGESAYEQIERYFAAGVYRAELWNLKIENGSIRIRLDKLKSKGSVVELAGPEAVVGATTSPVSIPLGKPTNDFERKVVGWYQRELNQIGPAPY